MTKKVSKGRTMKVMSNPQVIAALVCGACFIFGTILGIVLTPLVKKTESVPTINIDQKPPSIHVNISLPQPEDDKPVGLILRKGWNLIGYVRKETRSVEEALAPIVNDVIVVNGFESGKGGKTYDPKLPEFSNLKEFEYGKGYWIKVSRDVVINL